MSNNQPKTENIENKEGKVSDDTKQKRRSKGRLKKKVDESTKIPKPDSETQSDVKEASKSLVIIPKIPQKKSKTKLIPI